MRLSYIYYALYALYARCLPSRHRVARGRMYSVSSDITIKPGAPRGGGAPEDYLTSGVHIDSLVVNGQVTPWPGDDNTFT